MAETADSVQVCPWTQGSKTWDYLFLIKFFFF